MGKNPNLYSFDPVNYFPADNEENIDSSNLSLNLFVAFAEDKDEQSLGNIPLSIVLQEWNATSKCNEIILAQEDNKIDFYLNGFAPKGKKAPKEIKSKKSAI